jgi:hypothetical protein
LAASVVLGGSLPSTITVADVPAGSLPSAMSVSSVIRVPAGAAKRTSISLL